MIAVITNTITNDLEDENYRLFIFLRTKRRDSRKFRYYKSTVKGKRLSVRISVLDEKLTEEIAYNIAKVFAEHKEPIHIYIKDSCIVR